MTQNLGLLGRGAFQFISQRCLALGSSANKFKLKFVALRENNWLTLFLASLQDKGKF